LAGNMLYVTVGRHYPYWYCVRRTECLSIVSLYLRSIRKADKSNYYFCLQTTWH